MRPVGTASGIVFGRARVSGCDHGRQRESGECFGKRSDRDGRDHAVPARAGDALIRRIVEAALGSNVVVRAGLCARVGVESSGRGGGEAGVSVASVSGQSFPYTGNGAGLRSATGGSRKGEVCCRGASAALRLRGAGAGCSIDRAGMGQRTFAVAKPGAADVRLEHRPWLESHAGRVGTCSGGREPRRFHAARRPQQGHMGAVGWAGRYV